MGSCVRIPSDRADGEARVRTHPLLDRRDHHARIDGDRTARMGEHGVKIELSHLRQIGRELRHFNEHQFERLAIRRGHIAIAAYQPRHPRPINQLAGKLQVKRRQRQRPIVGDLRGRSTPAKNHDRPKGRVVDGPSRRRDEPSAAQPRAPQNVLGSQLNRFLAGQIEPHPVHIRLVDDVR